jgi:hypothetical protein
MTPRTRVMLAFSLGVLTASCGAGTPPVAASPSVTASPPAAPEPMKSAAPTASAPTYAPSPPIDEKAVAASTGVETPEKSPDGVIKASWPRKDVPIAVDGWNMPPFMGLTSWAAFSPGKQGVAEAMVMGDLVLFEDEVNPVMSKLLDAGLQVTALHNHFFFDQPKVFFMHIGGEGKVADLGAAVKSGLDEATAIRKKSPKPATTFGVAKLPAKSTIDAAKIDAAFDLEGQSKDGMYKAVWGRDTVAACGCPAGKAMGVNTWAAFAGTDDDAVVDGDFAVAESELQPVLKALRAGGINIVAIHHHMSGEQPRILFLHYWGRGSAGALANVVRGALDLTAWSGKPQ